MTFISKLFTSQRTILSFLSVLCILTLMDAYIAEHVFDIKPCVLCLYQRYVYMIVGGIALVGAFLNLRWFILLCGLGFLIGGGIAIYQVGIEQHIFELPNVCKATHTGGSIEDLKAQLMSKPVIPAMKLPGSF